MLKHTVVFAAAVLLALAVLGLDAPNRPNSMAGSWQVNVYWTIPSSSQRHSAYRRWEPDYSIIR